jgi:hypothetical protein
LRRHGQWALDDIGKRNTIHPLASRVIERVRHEYPIGTGAEKAVYKHPQHTDKVIAFHHGNPNMHDDEIPHEYTSEEMKAKFYILKLLELLMPGITPEVYLAGSQPPVLVLEKVEGAKFGESDKEYEAAESITIKLRKFGLDIDDSEVNFINRGDNNLTYVDSIDFNEFNSDEVKRAISKLPDEKQKKANYYLERINHLRAVIQNQNR